MKELELRYASDGIIEIGCDEAGRGCCAGPVVAASVILGDKFNYPGLRDSKKMSEKARNAAFEFLTCNDPERTGVLAWSIGGESPKIIDEVNILNASMMAMHKSIDRVYTDEAIVRSREHRILVDGNYFKPYHDVEYVCVVKGDDRYLAIAAASVIAKVFRDRFMDKLDMYYPNYKWASNKGYCTKAHLQAIANHGYTKHHRMSYSLTLPPKIEPEPQPLIIFGSMCEEQPRTDEEEVVAYFECLYGDRLTLDEVKKFDQLKEYCERNNYSEEFVLRTIDKKLKEIEHENKTGT